MRVTLPANTGHVLESHPSETARGLRSNPATHHQTSARRLAGFDQILAKVVVKGERRERLNNLLRSIDEQGSLVARTMRYEDLLRYRDLVQEFMQEAVQNAYGLKYDAGSKAGYRHKSYVLVEKIQEQLEQLALQVMEHERDPSPASTAPLNLLGRIDAIRGLLVDLLA